MELGGLVRLDRLLVADERSRLGGHFGAPHRIPVCGLYECRCPVPQPGSEAWV